MNWNPYLRAPFADVPLAFVDVETTGLRANAGDRVCEIAVVVYRGDGELHRYCSLIDPLRPISPGAAAVNGLTDADVRGAPAFAEVASLVAAALAMGVPVAHNAHFDLSFLANEMALAGVPFPVVPIVDTLGLARRLLPYESRSLPRLAARFGIRVPGQAHRALADALTTREVLRRLLSHPAAPRDPSLGEVLALQGGTVRGAPPLEIADAVHSGRAVRIVYVADDGESTSRVVVPKEVLTSGGMRYLVAFCQLRQADRTFRLDRIVAWEPA